MWSLLTRWEDSQSSSQMSWAPRWTCTFLDAGKVGGRREWEGEGERGREGRGQRERETGEREEDFFPVYPIHLHVPLYTLTYLYIRSYTPKRFHIPSYTSKYLKI